MNEQQKAVIRKELIQKMAFASYEEREVLRRKLKDLEIGRHGTQTTKS